MLQTMQNQFKYKNVKNQFKYNNNDDDGNTDKEQTSSRSGSIEARLAIHLSEIFNLVYGAIICSH